MMAIFMASLQQTGNAATLSGCVSNKTSKEKLAFINVRIIGTSLGANTDENGNYSIKGVKNGKYAVEASGIGFSSQEKLAEINGDTHLDFSILDDAFQLEQVVVTGNKSEVKRRNSSTLVNVLNAQVFDMVGGSCLADGLTYQPGVRVENDCQNCGFTQVRINGLDGHYSQILFDSRPVYSALAGVYGLEQIPANMIDRVEVIRGGGSALFGSSAIGGTINIITKDAIENSAEIAHNFTSIGVTGSLENNTTFNASLVTPNHKAGLFIYGQNRLRDAYDHNGDGYSEIPKIKSQTLGFRSFIRPSDFSRLTFQFHGTHEFRRGGDSLNRAPHQVNICEQVDHNIQGGALNFDLYSPDYNNKLNIFSSFQNTKRDSYYGANKDLNAYGWTKDFVIVTGAQYTRQISNLFFMPAEFVAGVEHNYNYLHDVAIGYHHDVTQKVNIYSAYLQNEWRTDRWGFLIGARLDKHDFIKSAIISPRANIRFNPSKNINFRATYSTGFRAPQAFDEDFHVAVVGGERVVTVLANGLKQESSQSISLSSDLYHNFGQVRTNLLIEAFYTDLTDVFALRKLDEPDALGNSVLERYNGSGARVFGLNLEGRAVFSSKFQLQAGATFQCSRYKKDEYWSENVDVPPTKKMFRTPDAYTYLTTKYTPIAPLSLSITGTFTGPMLVQHMEGSGTPIDIAKTTKSFLELNFKAAYDFTIMKQLKMQASIGILNFLNAYQKDFDLGTKRDSGYMYGPLMPRSIIAGIKFSI